MADRVVTLRRDRVTLEYVVHGLGGKILQGMSLQYSRVYGRAAAKMLRAHFVDATTKTSVSDLRTWCRICKSGRCRKAAA